MAAAAGISRGDRTALILPKVDFASPNFFYFCGEALFGQKRLTSRGQLVVRSWVTTWRWGDIRGIRPRGWDRILIRVGQNPLQVRRRTAQPCGRRSASAIMGMI
jgi:hypothetical protein